jgi:hypothetical protein
MASSVKLNSKNTGSNTMRSQLTQKIKCNGKEAVRITARKEIQI